MDSSREVFDLLVDCFDNQKSPTKEFDNLKMNNLLRHTDSEVRCWLAKALVFETNSRIAVEYLIRLARDDSADVRLEALDSLCAFACVDSFSALCAALKDSDILVRSIAAYGIASTGKVISPIQATEILNEAVKGECVDRVLVNMYEGLYILGNKSVITNIFMLISSEDYHVQAALLHALAEILDASNVGDISAFAVALNEADFPYAVVSALHELKDAIDYFYSTCIAQGRK